jgi:hypothetical protein
MLLITSGDLAHTMVAKLPSQILPPAMCSFPVGPRQVRGILRFAYGFLRSSQFFAGFQKCVTLGTHP